MRSSPHLNLDTIARMYALNEGKPAELAAFLLHLEGVCPDCDQSLLHLHQKGRLSRDAGWWQILLALSREQAAELWQSVRGLRGEMLVARLKSERFATWGFLERLCEESQHQATQDPRRSLELAELAVALAERLPREQLDQDCHREAQALAHAALGNACRVTEAWSRSRQAHTQAETLLRTIHEPYLGYTLGILMLRASLELGEKRLEAARAVLDEAFDLVAQDETTPTDPETLGALWIQQSMLHERQDDTDAAIRTARQALTILEPTGVRSRMLFCARYRLLWLLIHVGRLEEAAELFPNVESLTDEVAGATDRLKLVWLRARLCHLLDSMEECITHLRTAQEGFLKMGLCYHAVLVTLEMCKRLLDQGELAEVRLQASRLLPMLLGQRVAVEIMASVAMLKRAAEAGELSGELIDQIQGVLESPLRERRWLAVGG